MGQAEACGLKGQEKAVESSGNAVQNNQNNNTSTPLSPSNNILNVSQNKAPANRLPRRGSKQGVVVDVATRREGKQDKKKANPAERESSHSTKAFVTRWSRIAVPKEGDQVKEDDGH